MSVELLPQLKIKPLEFPESDGEPMAETGIHVTLIAFFLAMLRTFFRRRNDVYVGANMFLYYREDNPNKRLAPDLFVVFGVPNNERRTWRIWEEGKAPDVVFEFTSRSTWDEDLGSKKGLYEWMGVKEYFLYDPLREYLQPALQGFRLTTDGEYLPIPPGKAGELASEQLELVLRMEEGEIRLFDLKTAEPLLPPLELAETLERETSARKSLEAELAQLKEELERLKGKK
ncbi:MAG: Uma2 family endonuclease [Anaerolineales bacterium]